MKHTTLLCAALVCALAGPAFGQKKGSKAYFRFGAGYAVAHAGSTFTSNYVSGLAGGSVNYEFRKYSLGAGGQAMLAFGYKPTPHIALELGATALVIPKQYESNGSYATYDATNTVRSKTMISVVPALVLSTGGTGLEPYMRTGLLVPVKTGMRVMYADNDAPGRVTYTEDYEMRFGLGAQGALGLMYHAGRAAVYAELGGHAQTLYLKSSEIKDFSVNGRTIVLDDRDRLTNYEFEYFSSSTSLPNRNQPSTAATEAIPFSNVQFNIGLKLSF